MVCVCVILWWDDSEFVFKSGMWVRGITLQRVFGMNLTVAGPSHTRFRELTLQAWWTLSVSVSCEDGMKMTVR
jgi:hypothetical protein